MHLFGKQSSQLSDTLSFIAELKRMAEVDMANPRINQKQREECGLLADFYADCWANLHAKLHPLRVQGVELPFECSLQSLSLWQLKSIVERAENMQLTGDTAIHLQVDAGMQVAFIVDPTLDNGGAELLRGKSIVTP